MPGPNGGLFGLIGRGIAMGAEYREHRKEQKQARSAAEPAAQQPEPAQRDRTQIIEPDWLPAYADLPATTDRQLDPTPPPPAEKQAELSSAEESDTDETESIEDDEELLALDEALFSMDSKDLPTYEESEAHHQSVDELVREIMTTSRPPLNNSPSGEGLSRPQLPCPVILPQRRPRKKARGFIRAYSPVLEDCGIGQEVFLKFLKNFHKSSQASPVFTIIRVSATIAGLAPSVIAMAVCTAAQIAAGVGAEVQSRTRTNNFLDCMNEELFQPAGLYAMIVKYKSNADVKQSTSGIAGLANLVRAERLDVTTNQSIARYSRKTTDGIAGRSISNRMNNMRLTSGTTTGTAMLPDSAPLIFPDIDKKVAEAGPETFKDKTKDVKKFLADYLDRRAQMSYARQEPQSCLAVPEQQRAVQSPLADPNHPMYSGGLVALVSGGKLTPRMGKRKRRTDRPLSRDEERLARRESRALKRYGEAYHEDLYDHTGIRGAGLEARIGSADVGTSREVGAGEGSSSSPVHCRGATRTGTGKRRREGRPLGAVKRAMREDVMYLMIVNMPSDSELAKAKDELENAKRH